MASRSSIESCLQLFNSDTTDRPTIFPNRETSYFPNDRLNWCVREVVAVREMFITIKMTDVLLEIPWATLMVAVATTLKNNFHNGFDKSFYNISLILSSLTGSSVAVYWQFAVFHCSESTVEGKTPVGIVYREYCADLNLFICPQQVPNNT